MLIHAATVEVMIVAMTPPKSLKKLQDSRSHSLITSPQPVSQQAGRCSATLWREQEGSLLRK
jgi:hypothetical protein